jgi:hypothetical protein
MPTLDQTSKSLLLAAALVAPAPAQALQVDSGVFNQRLDQLELISATAPARSWETHLLSLQGINCIALGRGAFLAPQHSGVPWGAYDIQQLTNSGGKNSDPLLFRLSDEQYQALPDLPISEQLQRPKGLLVTAGPGHASAGWSYYAGRGESPIGPFPEWKTDCFAVSASKNGKSQDPGFAKINSYDSGAAVFVFDAGANSWDLGGMVLYVPSEYAATGASPQAFCADLSLASGYGKAIQEYRERAPREEPPILTRLGYSGYSALALGAAAAAWAWRRRAERPEPRPSH